MVLTKGWPGSTEPGCSVQREWGEKKEKETGQMKTNEDAGVKESKDDRERIKKWR